MTRAQQSSRDDDALSSMEMSELVRAMEVAAASELYSESSTYRDEYNARLQTVVGQVEDCNARFYKAFSMSDLGTRTCFEMIIHRRDCFVICTQSLICNF